MKSIALGFLCGVLALQWMRDLPVVHWCWLLPLCLLAIIYLPRLRIVFAAMAGFLWVLLSAHNYSTPGLHTALEGIDLEVTGTLFSIPVQQSRATRSLFDIDSLNGNSTITPPERVRLHWYQDAPDNLRPGQRWQLTVRLKRPYGFSNPGVSITRPSCFGRVYRRLVMCVKAILIYCLSIRQLSGHWISFGTN